MSDEEQKPRTQSKEVRALMKNAARSSRSQRARDLLCKLISMTSLDCPSSSLVYATSRGDQTGLEVDPIKITSTKYNREIGVKFVPQDEATFRWPFISTSQISSHDLAALETAVAHDKVIATKDDIYNASASFRSRNGSRASISLPPTPQQQQYLQSHHTHPHSHEFQQPHQSPQQQHQFPPFRSPGGPFLGAGASIHQQQPQSQHHPGQNSRLNSLAEASSSSQPWINAASSTSITQFSPTHPSQTTPENSTTDNANIEPSIMLNDTTAATTMASATATSFSPLHSVPATSSRKRSRSPDTHQDTHHLSTGTDMEIDDAGFIRIKIPRLSIKDIMDEESKGQLKRIHELEAQLAEITELHQRQNQEIQALRAENERLMFGGGGTSVVNGENEELLELRAENERLKALGRKLFE